MPDGTVRWWHRLGAAPQRIQVQRAGVGALIPQINPAVLLLLVVLLNVLHPYASLLVLGSGEVRIQC